VVWQGSAGNRRPYADLVGYSEIDQFPIMVEKRGYRKVAPLAQVRPGHLSDNPTYRPLTA